MKTHNHFHGEELSPLQRDDFFFDTLQTGNTDIQVKIIEPGYENIKPAKISLQIVSPFVIEAEDEMVDPQETLYIAPTCDFKFKLALYKKTEEGISFEDTPIPNPQYKWSLRNSAYGAITSAGLF